MNVEEILKFRNDILVVCIDEPITNGLMLNQQERSGYVCWQEIYHHIPYKPTQNENYSPLFCKECWAIDNANEIYEKTCKLEEYAKYLLDKYCVGPYKFDFSNVEDTILPHWILFPQYPYNTIYWRQGIAEAYVDLYTTYRQTLCDEELAKLDCKYPMPNYFK